MSQILDITIIFRKIIGAHRILFIGELSKINFSFEKSMAL